MISRCNRNASLSTRGQYRNGMLAKCTSSSSDRIPKSAFTISSYNRLRCVSKICCTVFVLRLRCDPTTAGAPAGNAFPSPDTEVDVSILTSIAPPVLKSTKSPRSDEDVMTRKPLKPL